MSREVVHVGRKIRVEIDCSPGANGQIIQRDLIFHPGAVVILPILANGDVVLLRNFRFVLNETLWEVPAGTVEPDEPLLDCAKRELLEETGYTAKQWKSLGYLYASPGVLDEKLHLFVAEHLTPGPQQLEPDEKIEPVIVPYAEAVQMCLRGEIRDAKTVTALLLVERLRAV